MEKISRRLSAPPKPGALAPTKWFYERARGQYKDSSAYGSRGERQRFTSEFPKNQVINKTDLAKYEATYSCNPHLVSRGAQKCFMDFAEDVSKSWEEKPAQFNEGYFRTAIAKAILFRETDRLVGQSDWYKADRGYKANINTYTIACLVNHLKTQKDAALDLQAIWSRQELASELAETILNVSQQVSTAIKDTPENARNVSEYAKQQQCWARVSKLEIKLPAEISSWTMSLAEEVHQQREDLATGRIDREINFETALVALQPRVSEIREFVMTTGTMLTPSSSSALSKVERLNFNLNRNEKSALKTLFEEIQERGFELSVE
jgi:hypothetical protein